MNTLDIFLSYARGDDKEFVARLYSNLTARGFKVWWDRSLMPSRGLTFLQEIRDAIDASQRLLLVIGPGSVTSDYVVAEWNYAITYGKVISPILRLGDFELLPDELKLLHVEDFRDDVRFEFHFENLVRQLAAPIAPMGRLVGVPSLPRHLLSTSIGIESVKKAFLADTRQPTHGTEVACLGLFGMGGIGKSVLANLVARDPEVRRVFPDGIIWISFGTEPNLVQLQRYVAKAFGDPGIFDNVDQGKAKLGEILASKAVMLVLDDIWKRSHAEALTGFGPKCRAVLTTRDAGIVASLGCNQHQMELLSEEESLKLLARSVGVDPQQIPDEAKEVVSECNCLPLALALCAGMNNRGVSWTSILQRLKQGALESINDRNVEASAHRNIWAAMKISVDALTIDEQLRFIELCVFQEDASVPEIAVHTLWSHTGGMDNFACEDLLISLSERSLIRIDVETPDAGESLSRRISIHDLLHDFISKRAGDVVPFHNQLLEAYSKLCSTGWSSGPNDGYFFQSLCNHMLLGNRLDDAFSLLTELPWIEVKSRFGLIYELKSDYVRILNFLSDPLSPEEIVKVIALKTASLEVDYRVSLHNPDDLQLLVLLERADEAVAIARSVTDPTRRFDLLIGLHSTVQGNRELGAKLLSWAHDAARLIVQDWCRVPKLTELAEVLAMSGRMAAADAVFAESVTEAKSIGNEGNRNSEIAKLSRMIAERGQTGEAEKLAGTITDANYQAESLVHIAKASLRAGDTSNAHTLLSRAKGIAEGIDYALPATEVSISMVSAWAELGDIDEARAAISRADLIASHIPDMQDRDGTWFRLAETIAQTGLVSDAKELADRNPWPSVRRGLVTGLLVAGHITEAISVLDQMELDEERDYAALEVAMELLKTGDLELSEDCVNSISLPYFKAKGAIKVISERLNRGATDSDAMKLVYEIIDQISDTNARLGALVFLADELAALGSEHEADAALESARTKITKGNEYRLGEIADSYARHGNFEKAQLTANEIEEPFHRANSLRRLALQCAKSDRRSIAERVFQNVILSERENTETWRGKDMAKALTKVGVSLMETGYRESGIKALEIAGSIIEGIGGDPSYRAVSRSDWVKVLERFGLVGLLSEATTAMEEDYYHSRLKAEYRLALLLERSGQREKADAIFADVMERTMEIENDLQRSEKLTELGKALAEAGRDLEADAVFTKSEQVALNTNISHSDSPETYLGRLVVTLAETGRFDDAQRVLQRIETDWQREWPESEFALSLANTGRTTEAIKLADEIPAGHEAYWKQKTYQQLISILAERGLLREAWDIVDTKLYESSMTEALMPLINACARQNREGEFARALSLTTSAIEHLSEPRPRCIGYANLCLALVECGRQQDAERLLNTALDTAKIDSELNSDSEAIRDAKLATCTVRLGRIAEAISRFPVNNMESFLTRVCDWSSDLNAHQPKLLASAIDAALRVMLWEHPEFEWLISEIARERNQPLH